MQPGKEAFYFPTALIAPQFVAILGFGLFSALSVGRNHFDTSLVLSGVGPS
jgi:hypothetical protein